MGSLKYLESLKPKILISAGFDSVFRPSEVTEGHTFYCGTELVRIFFFPMEKLKTEYFNLEMLL